MDWEPAYNGPEWPPTRVSCAECGLTLSDPAVEIRIALAAPAMPCPNCASKERVYDFPVPGGPFKPFRAVQRDVTIAAPAAEATATATIPNVSTLEEFLALPP